MPDRSFIVDSYDYGTLGFAVTDVSDQRSATDRRYAKAYVPGAYGEVLLSDQPVYQGRTIKVKGVIDATTLSSAYSAMDQMKWRLSNGLHEITFVDDESRVFFGYYVGGRITGLRPHLWAKMWEAEFEVFCPDARSFSAASTVSCSTAGAEIPTGNAPVLPMFQIDGALAAANIVIYSQTSTGGAVSTFQVNSVTISSTESVYIDTGTQTILTSTGGSLIADWASSIGGFITIDPHYGDPYNSSFPIIKSGIAGKSVKVIYRKAYW